MAKKTKTIITTILLIMAVVQGPYFYYFPNSFEIIILPLSYLVAVYLTVYLLIKLIKYKPTTTWYHIIGLSFAFLIGTIQYSFQITEQLDFKCRKNERLEIVKQVMNRRLKPNDSINNELCHLPKTTFLPISSGNTIGVKKCNNGIVSVEFYIDIGFLDHYNAFLYTNDPVEIKDLDNKIARKEKYIYINKLEDNWYRLNY
jgi:hypothetical protein